MTVLTNGTYDLVSFGFIILGFSFLAFVVCFFLLKGSNNASSFISISASLLCLILGAIILLSYKGEVTAELKWFKVGDLSFPINLKIDGITACLLFVISIVSFLAQLFSKEYMSAERNLWKYYSYLSLFSFSMYALVLSNNLLITFIFWELVGFSSYILIGFWYTKDSASTAAQKAFIINRIGDAGFVIGLIIVWSHFSSFDLSNIQQSMSNISLENTVGGTQWAQETSFKQGSKEMWGTIMALGLFCGVISKSAQFPLFTWLPDAMEGPTPVSALIHAATMVAAGVYLLGKVFFLMNPIALDTMAIVGGITTVMGASVAISQIDIKRVLAFSTISQLGYMVFAMGVGAYEAALFHLITHAFFKACLFLAAGSVIHALHKASYGSHRFDTQDMRLMGGLRKRMPITFYTYLLATASLIGLPFFSGFLSKDAIIEKGLNWAVERGESWTLALSAITVIVIALTSFYMTRQIILVFFGQFRLPLQDKTYSNVDIKENNWLITFTLITLALLSTFIVFSFNPLKLDHSWISRLIEMPETYLINNDLYGSHHVSPITVSGLSILMSMLGIGLAIKKYHGIDYQRSLLMNKLQ